jgi:hypothetical protein
MRVEDLERVHDVLVGHAIRRWQRTGAPTSLSLDLDSSDAPTHGQQQFSLFNGHYGTHCGHQIDIFTAGGDLLWAKLLSGTGNVRASARDWFVKLVAAL